jgi:NDP-sugar pyrophosphorylase family protein
MKDILGGGLGSRLSDQTATRSKPLIEICGRPILWHTVKKYAYRGASEFVICRRYRGDVIKEYFASYFLRRHPSGDLSFNEQSAEEALAVHCGGPVHRLLWRPCISGSLSVLAFIKFFVRARNRVRLSAGLVSI